MKLPVKNSLLLLRLGHSQGADRFRAIGMPPCGECCRQVEELSHCNPGCVTLTSPFAPQRFVLRPGELNEAGLMSIHVALLRGINVAGHNPVAMADLRKLL